MTFIVDSCECGHWDLFDFSASTPNTDAQYPDQSCGSVLPGYDSELNDQFSSGGFICLGECCYLFI
jgi:hypothetical protein